jgi:hypothetical protein
VLIKLIQPDPFCLLACSCAGLGAIRSRSLPACVVVRVVVTAPTDAGQCSIKKSETGDWILISHVEKQIHLVLILRTTHPVVDDSCHQARCKDPDDPLPGAPTIGLGFRQVHQGMLGGRFEVREIEGSGRDACNTLRPIRGGSVLPCIRDEKPPKLMMGGCSGWYDVY